MKSTFIPKVIRENLTREGLTNVGSRIYRVVHPLHVFKAAWAPGPIARQKAIVNLIIPKGALVHIPARPKGWEDEWKCRASVAYVHSIAAQHWPHKQFDTAFSNYNLFFAYKVGEPVCPRLFYHHNGECAPGIHFFFDLSQAQRFL